MNEIMAICAVILGIMLIAVFVALFYAYVLAIKRCEDLEDRLMAKNLTEYSQKKASDAFIKKIEKEKKEDDAPVEMLEKGEVV